MSESLFLRIKSLNVKTMHGVSSAKNVIKVAAMHNLREIVAEFGVRANSHIDLARVALNYQLRGPATAAGVADLALALLNNAGVHKLRKDACMALELVFSLPQGSAVDHREYFAAAVAWADGFFNVPILSAAVHLDEPAKHCHVLLLPLVGGRMKGGALAGGPTKIKMMLSDFQQQVGQRFGLTHQPRVKRLSKPNRDQAGRAVLEALKARPEWLNEPALQAALVVALGREPGSLLALLGLNVPAAKTKAKSFVAIMTAPCKPERSTRARKSIDIAYPTSIDVHSAGATQAAPNSATSFLCIDVAPPNPAFPDDFHQRQPLTTTPAPRVHVETVSSAQVQTVSLGQAAGSGKFPDTLGAIPASVTVVTRKTKPKDYVGLVKDHQAGAAAPSDVLHTKPNSTTTLPAMQDARESARISAPPDNAHRRAAKDTLKTQRISPAPGSAGQSAENSAQCDSPKFSGQEHSPEYFGQLQQAGHPTDEEGRHAASAHGQHWVPVPGTTSSTTALGAAPAHDSEDIPKIGDTPTAAGGDPLKTEQVDHHGKADFQRQRDDDHLAEHWDADRGEFVTVPSALARPPGRHGRAPYTARASPDDSQHPAPPTIHRSRTESYP